ncbi:MAG: MBL fold metallo-hydrolase, partial [Bacteroidales bacterium]|nr:MBL fold metallo-hydrolase [Bacteroidales bacterium]
NHPLPKGNRNLLVRKDGEYCPDTFGHEMALYVDGLLFTGCAHNGLENILEACPWPVNVVLGGFHLLDSQGGNVYESEEELKTLAGRLMEKYPGTTFYTSHCTEDGAFRTLKAVMGERLHHFHCGEIF